jgi:hypothetical protein
MAVATLAVAVCNFFQNMSLRDQVTLAQNTLLENRRATDIATRTYIASHRPKPTVRFVSISDEIIVSNTISGTLMIFNTGETSATLQRYYSEIANRQDSSCTKRELYIGRWKKGSVTRWLLVCVQRLNSLVMAPETLKVSRLTTRFERTSQRLKGMPLCLPPRRLSTLLKIFL